MLSASKQKVAFNKDEVFVHCRRCHDVFTMGVTFRGNRILTYDPSPHITETNHSRNKNLKCHCGGILDFFRC